LDLNIAPDSSAILDEINGTVNAGIIAIEVRAGHGD